jgi:hypothetical protein
MTIRATGGEFEADILKIFRRAAAKFLKPHDSGFRGKALMMCQTPVWR